MSINTIRLGLMPPLSGMVGMYGTEIVHAARIACDEVNQRGGVLGRQLELIIEDDGSQPSTAIPAALRLIDEHKCSAIIGNLLSNSRIAVAAQVAEPKHIPYLNFSFYEGSISGRYFFHFAALPNQQIDKMIPYMARNFGPKMFFAGNNYEWPRGSIDAAKRSLHLCGGIIVGEEYLSIGASELEIENLLDQLARSGADVFVPYFAGADQITLLTRFSERGLKKRMAVVMGHYDEVMVSSLSADVRAGFYSSNTYFMSVDTPENKRYLARLAQLPGISGIWPHGNGMMSNFGEGTYLCVHAYAKAVTAARTTDAEAVVDALENVTLIGPQGEVKMDKATHHAYVNTYLSRCNADGTFSIMEQFGLIPPQIPSRYESKQTRHELPTPLDITARITEEAQTAMRKLGAAQQILSMADMAILATDEKGFILEANKKIASLFGYTVEEMVGMSVHLLLPPHLRARHTGMVQHFAEGEKTERRMSERSEVTGYRKDGSFFPLEATIGKFRTDGAWTLVITMRDISEIKKAEEELLWRATHDVLTDLPNRALIRERLINALERSRRQNMNVALLFIDLDGFKEVNDAHGHETGDELLRSMAARILDLMRPGDTLARLAGDEFLVLCEQLEHPSTISALAERINQALREPFQHKDVQLYITASIGIAIGHGSTQTADDLLRSSDIAMYAVKAKGRDGWQFFNEGLQEQARQRLSISQGLHLAIEREELSVRFQPIVSLREEHIVGAELLLRWHPPEGEIPPSVFIPVAEMSGLIIAIGTWVFREGCRAEAAWRRNWGASAPAYISINISARQLGYEALAKSFADILLETAADPTRILIEVTETALMADVETNLRMLRALAGLGLRVAVDDFGTGYSSLAQLTRMPVNVLKIDKAFVDGIERQQESRTIINAIISLGKALNLKLVAEGVETKAQLTELFERGCDFAQGYYFYRPLDETAFFEAIENQLEVSRVKNG